MSITRSRSVWQPLPESAGGDEVLRVEAAAEICEGHREPGARRVHEAAVAGVDADVIDAARADMEEDQISRRELRERYGLRGALLSGGGARNGEPDVLVYVEREPAAIEAALIGAAELIAGTDERSRNAGDHRAGVGGRCGRRRRWRRRGWRSRGRHGHRRTTGQQQRAEQPGYGAHAR